MMANMPQQAGGPVGGGMVMMNNGGGIGTPSSNTSQDQMKTNLNTHIYEYFLKLGHYELARSLVKNDKFDILTIKQSPGRRKDGDMNGDAMDMDGNDDIPEDLPRPQTQDSPGNGFLFDWFSLFHDMFHAQRQKGNGPEASLARQYISQTTNQQRQRENLQNAKLPGNGMMAGTPQQIAAMRQMRMNGDMQRAALAKSMTPQQMTQMKMMQQQQQQQNQQQMQRDGSDMGINGQRPSTPAEGENGGSPSKRPRLDGQQQFNGGMMPNGRGQGMSNVNQGLLMQSGFNPNNMNQAQFRQNGALQQKAMQGTPMANGINMMGNTGSPMMGNIDPQFNVNGMGGMEGITYARMQGQAGMQGPTAQSGNHALQDYQMQLMLLEQQNKKRLMMARQEQDNITRGDGAAPMPGQVGMQPPGMSPSGSRAGTSPLPMDQMKRGNAQMSGTGSPSAGDTQGRGSPINFMHNMAPDFNNALFMNNKDGLVPGGPGMRQPNMDINALRAQQGRMAGQFPPGQPMVQNPSQGQPQPMGTPGQRNEMPPPSAPATGGSAQRGQPSSPNSGGAPPTPSQTNKPNPKGKKGKEGDNARKRPNKKNSTTNANAEDPPATPTPSTPITPVHTASFSTSGGKGPGAANANPAPTSNPTSQPVQQMTQPDPSLNGFDNYAGDNSFNLDFSTLENPDVLENFDFDSFLNQGESDFTTDFTFAGDGNIDLSGVTDG